MKRLVGSIVAGALAASGMSSTALASMVETFGAYPDGPLTTGSGGVWELWAAASGDAVVSGGSAIINHNTDVARLFGNELQSVGSVVSYSFEVNIAQANVVDDYTTFFSPASSPFDGSPGQNYGESLGFAFDWGTGAGGTSTVAVWPNAGSTISIGTITPGVFHTISGTMTKNAASIDYTVQIDGGAPFAGSFAHTDARGINGFEMYQQDANGLRDNNFRVDNLIMTPEPASLALLAIGGLSLLRRRR